METPGNALVTTQGNVVLYPTRNEQGTLPKKVLHIKTCRQDRLIPMGGLALVVICTLINPFAGIVAIHSYMRMMKVFKKGNVKESMKYRRDIYYLTIGVMSSFLLIAVCAFLGRLTYVHMSQEDTYTPPMKNFKASKELISHLNTAWNDYVGRRKTKPLEMQKNETSYHDNTGTIIKYKLLSDLYKNNTAKNSSGTF